MNKKHISIILLSLLMFFTSLFNAEKEEVKAEVKTSDIKPLQVVIGDSTIDFYPVIDNNNPVPSGAKFYTKVGSNYVEISPSGSSVSMTDIGYATNSLSSTVYYYNPTSTNINCVSFINKTYNHVFDSDGYLLNNYIKVYYDYDVYDNSNCSNWNNNNKTPKIFGCSFYDILNGFNKYKSSCFLTSKFNNSSSCWCYMASNDSFVTANRNDGATYIPLVNSFGVTASCYITYNGNNATSGSVPTDETLYRPNNSVTVLGNTGNLTKTGYTFGGWNSKEDGSGITYAANSSFTITSDTTLYALWLKNVSITETAQTKTYDSSEHGFDILGTDKDIGNFAIEYKVHGADDSTYTFNKPSFAGSYDVKITRNSLNGYAAYSKTIENGLVINKRQIAVPTVTADVIYDGTVKGPTWSDTTYVNYENDTMSDTVGNHDVTFVLNDKVNTTWTDNTTDNKTGSWTLKPKTIYKSDITWSNTTVTFNGTAQAPIGAFKDGVIASGDTCSITAGSYTAANESGYNPVCSLSNNSYVLDDVYCTRFYVLPLDITDTIEFSNTSIRYDGEEHGPSITSSQIIFGYPCNGVFTGKATEVGDYTATLTELTSANYKYSANPYLTVNYSITPTYLVEFNGNGGNGSLPTDSNRYAVGDEITLPYFTGVTKQGYSFVGWNSDNTSTTGYTSTYTIKDSDIKDGKITFYATFVNGDITVNNNTYNVILNNFNQDKLESGYYYLNADYTVPNTIGEIEIDEGNTIYLYLNGYVLNLDGHSFALNGSLYIYDDKNDDQHIHYFSENDDKKWILDESNTTSSLKCKGGVICGGSVSIHTEDNDGLPNNATLSCVGVNFIGNQNNAIQYHSNNPLYIKDCNFLGNISYNSAAAIYVAANANIYDSTFMYNIASQEGGAIECRYKSISNGFITTKCLISGCVIKYNNADKGGGLYLCNNITTLINTTISNNTTSSAGGGIYAEYDQSACLAEGTLITMADNTLKDIKDIKEGDYVKTFDHLSNQYISSRVYYAYKGESTARYFTLNFKSGNSLSIVGLHDLFNKEENKYVRISEYNYSSYIGKYFYDAVNERYDQLVSVTKSYDEKNYYSIYTESTFNCIANNMLTIPDDADFEYSIFEFNSDLSINQDVLNADIEEYGLLDFNDCEIVTDYDDFRMYNIQYYYIWLGKGVEGFEKIFDYYVDEMKTNNFRSARRLLGASIPTFDTYGAEVYGDSDPQQTWLILGDDVVVKDNITNNGTIYASNLFIEPNCYLKIVGTKNISVGVRGTYDYIIIDEEEKHDYRSFIYGDDGNSTIFSFYDEDDENYNYKITVGYKIVYNENGGSGTVPTDNMIYENGETITLANNTLTKTGYAFKGWSLNNNNNLTSVLSTYSINPTDSFDFKITLYAVWGEKTEIVVTNKDNENNYSDAYARYGSTPTFEYSATGNLTDFMYKWDTDVEGVYTDTMPTTVGKHTGVMYRNEDDTYKAYTRTIFLTIGYQVIYDNNGGSGTIVDNGYYGYDYEYAPIKEGTDISKTGYTFVCWNYKADGTGSNVNPNPNKLYELSANTTLYAVWAANIDEQPSSSNDYEVKLEDATSTTNTYQWFKGTARWTNELDGEVNLQSGSKNGSNYDSSFIPFFGGFYAINFEYKGKYNQPLLKFKSLDYNGDLSLGDDGYYHQTLTEGIFSISASTSFTISDVELYTAVFNKINGETNKKLGSINEEGIYMCIVYSSSSGSTNSSLIYTSKIEFNANDGSGTAPSAMYQLAGRNITLPTSSLTKTNYFFKGWNNTSNATTVLDNTYPVTGNATLYAIFEEKGQAVISNFNPLDTGCGDAINLDATTNYGTIVYTYSIYGNNNFIALNSYITKPGKYDIKATVAEADSYYGASITKTIEIKEKKVSADQAMKNNNVEGSKVSLIEGSVGINITVVIKNQENKKDSNLSKSIKELFGKLSTIIGRFDIHLEDNNGATVENIDGNKYRVSIAIPEKLQGRDNYKIVYIDSDGNITEYQSTLENDVITFETDHFSSWALVADSATLPVWAIILIILGSLIIIYAVMFIFWKIEYDKVIKEDLPDKARKLRFLDVVNKPINKLLFDKK